jgi:hypothetical protein
LITIIKEIKQQTCVLIAAIPILGYRVLGYRVLGYRVALTRSGLINT